MKIALSRICVVLVISIPSIWIGEAAANDTTVSIGIGGLAFEKSETIAMKSEVLRISPNEIEVQYVFQNVGKVDETTKVAFPLPDLSGEAYVYWNIEWPAPTTGTKGAKTRFVPFRTWANDVEVIPKLDARALTRDGKDITAELAKIGLSPFDVETPVDDHADPTTVSAVDALLTKVGSPEEHDWILHLNYYWQQTFPAGAEIRIRHLYNPILAGTHAKPSDLPANACGDKDLISALSKDPKYLDLFGDEMYALPQWVDYILTTGNNWAGPIQYFKIILDKGHADLLSTCPIPGLHLQKYGNTFVGTARNYEPKKDISVYFFTK